jgi:hypothetical protein
MRGKIDHFSIRTNPGEGPAQAINGWARGVLYAGGLGAFLGLGIHWLVLTLEMGDPLKTMLNARFLAGLPGSVIRSALACGALVLSTKAGRHRPAAMGLAALLGSLLTHAFVRTTTPFLDLLEKERTLYLLVTVALLKGTGCLLLGIDLGQLSRRGEVRLQRFLLPGLLTGIALGPLVVGSAAWWGAHRYTAAERAAWLFEEIVFPPGCTLVFYLSQALTRQLAANVAMPDAMVTRAGALHSARSRPTLTQRRSRRGDTLLWSNMPPLRREQAPRREILNYLGRS